MDLKNSSYVIYMGTKNFTEKYYRDEKGWLKISARGKAFRMTAEQVLNHLLPAAAGVKPGLILKVVHQELAKKSRLIQKLNRRLPSRALSGPMQSAAP